MGNAMAPRSLATGTVSFGLVAIPVKVYPSGESSAAIRFNQLHAPCGTRIRQQLYCPTCDTTVSREELVKGYEFAKGQYVTFTTDELAELGEKPSHAIEIREFVPLDRVDPIYYEKAYYLGPDRGGDRPFKLLARAMTSSGRAAIAQYSARGKQYLVLLRPFGDGVVMQQMRYPDEIRSYDEVPVGDAEPDEGELDLALRLIDQISSEEFRPDAYEDAVRRRMVTAIERKVEGEEISAEPAEAQRAQVVDLMSALKASLGEEERRPAKRAAEKKKTARRKKASSGG